MCQTSLFVVPRENLLGMTNVKGDMNSYWESCKDKDRFITGNTKDVCQNRPTWTGLRKYVIGK